MAITAAALVPHPPLLVPELGRGASSDLEQLRSACRRAVSLVLDRVDALLVVGPAASWGEVAPGATGSLAPYGAAVTTTLPATPAQAAAPAGGDWLDRHDLPSGRLTELPLSLAIAGWLLGQAAGECPVGRVAAFGVPASMRVEQAVATGRALAGAVPAGEHVGLLAMGDLSARRTPKAPATFHPAAEEFDRQIADAMRKADLARLLDADPRLAAELRVGGMATLWLLAGAFHDAGPQLRTEVLYEAAPFGVGYLVGVVESR
jgi:aromatic ring-opening dioxygenase LigB subunit